jgi:hypothetical protein
LYAFSNERSIVEIGVDTADRAEKSEVLCFFETGDDNVGARGQFLDYVHACSHIFSPDVIFVRTDHFTHHFSNHLRIVFCTYGSLHTSTLEGSAHSLRSWKIEHILTA